MPRCGGNGNIESMPPKLAVTSGTPDLAASAAAMSEIVGYGFFHGQWLPASGLGKKFADFVEGGAEECRRGQCHDPGKDDVAGDVPAHACDLAGGAYPYDCPRYGVRGRDRNTEICRQEERHRASGLGTEALHGMQSGNPRAHGMHDAPAANQRPKAHRGLANQDDPEWYVKSRTEETLGIEQHGNDAHCLLCIVAPVPERIERG